MTNAKNQKFKRVKGFVFLLIGIILSAIVGCFITMNSRELTVIRQIENKGGYVNFAYYGPRWFAEHIGRWYPFKSVEIVALGDKCTDGDVAIVPMLRQAKFVFLNGTKIEGSGLSLLKIMPNLQEVDLTKSSITDDGLNYIGDLKNIKSLILARTGITDQGVVHLEPLKELKELNLEDTKVTDKSLHYLSSLPLKELDVRKTLVTTNGIAFLKARNPSVDIVH